MAAGIKKCLIQYPFLKEKYASMVYYDAVK